MKRINLRFPAIVLSVLMLAACSPDATVDEPDTPAVPDDRLHDVEIKLDLGVSGGLFNGSGTSKVNPLNTAPRELLSFDNEQCVTDLRIYVFRSETADGEYLYAGSGTDYLGVPTDDGGYLVSRPGVFNDTIPRAGEFERHIYTFEPKLPTGFYKFLAVGRGDVDLENKSDKMIWARKTYNSVNFKIDKTNFHNAGLSNMRASVTALHIPNYSHEVFTGIMLTGDGKEDYIEVSREKAKQAFHKRIELTRAVAGIYAVLTDIPCQFFDLDKYYECLEMEEYPKPEDAIVGASTNLDIINILLSIGSGELLLADKTYGKTYKNINVGQVETTDETWERENPPYLGISARSHKGIEIPANCCFMSNFMLPMDSLPPSGSLVDATLYIQYGAGTVSGGTKVSYKRSFPVKMKAYVDKNGNKVDISSDDPTKFPITANCIYAIGTLDHPISLKGTSGFVNDDPEQGAIIPPKGTRSRSSANNELCIPMTVYASPEAFVRATRGNH